MRNVRAAAVQFESVSGDLSANWRKIYEIVAQVAAEQVELIVFPAYCVTGHRFLRRLSRGALQAFAEPVPGGPTCRLLYELSERYQMTIGVGLLELAQNGELYSTYVITAPSGMLRRHRQLHCMISAEFSSGSEYTVFSSPFGCKIGVLAGEDSQLVENARITALEGAQILLVPHQTGGRASVSPHGTKRIDLALWAGRHEDPEAIAREFAGASAREWLLRWLPARAHDNGMFVIFSNGVGIDDDEIRTGNAMLIGPDGQIIAETCKAGENIVIADLDLDLLINCSGARWMRERRPELYLPLLKPMDQQVEVKSVRFGKA